MGLSKEREKEAREYARRWLTKKSPLSAPSRLLDESLAEILELRQEVERLRAEMRSVLHLDNHNAIVNQKNAELAALRADRDRLREALRDMTEDPTDCDYPISDVYGMSLPEDRRAPLFTEAGLYGRVGKEAARTMLYRVRHAREALAQSEKETP